jgi:aspartyl protease family protein
MPTGFMPRHFIALCVLLACGVAPIGVRAADVSLIGVIGSGAAVIAIDGGEPRTIKVGQTRLGVTVLAVERERATIEVEGKARVLSLGQHYRGASSKPSIPGAGQTVTLSADAHGHYISEGTINGHPLRFVVDTGATSVAIPAAEAVRMGIDYHKGTAGKTRTAGGVVSVYRVMLDSVRVGAIEASNVECIVIEQGLADALLGMSFLNRVDMRQEGRTMTLIKRF